MSLHSILSPKKLCPICFATLDVCRKSLACFSLLNIP
nr:MAG TPA: hypothetical protein [Caudoviricetes sp.]